MMAPNFRKPVSCILSFILILTGGSIALSYSPPRPLSIFPPSSSLPSSPSLAYRIDSSSLQDPSNYKEKAAIDATIQCTYQLKSTSSSINHAQFWIQRLQNHSTLEYPGVAPIQEGKLLSIDYTHPDATHHIDYADINDNVVEYFGVNLSQNQISCCSEP